MIKTSLLLLRNKVVIYSAHNSQFWYVDIHSRKFPQGHVCPPILLPILHHCHHHHHDQKLRSDAGGRVVQLLNHCHHHHVQKLLWSDAGGREVPARGFPNPAPAARWPSYWDPSKVNLNWSFNLNLIWIFFAARWPSYWDPSKVVWKFKF